MARKFLDKDGLTALWAKIVDKINSIGDNFVKKTGDIMTGQLKTSFKESVAMGSFHAQDSTLPDFCNLVRFSSGANGSVVITNDYTQNGVTVVNGWYNFFYSPHRSGGVNGESSGDNCNYGTLILSAMTANRNPYIIRIHGTSPYIANIYQVTVENDVAGKVNRSGDTMSGSLTIAQNGSPVFLAKATQVDASKANNNVSSTAYPGFSTFDNAGRILTRNEAAIYPNGNIKNYLYARNYNTSGTQVAQKGLGFTMDKSGNLAWEVDDASNFRSAIGLPIDWDFNTKNTTDSWVPVSGSGKIQHRVLSATLNEKTVKNATALHSLGYSASDIPTTQFMAYWNGAYDSNGNSNLARCNRGAFGTVVTKGVTNATNYSTSTYPQQGERVLQFDSSASNITPSHMRTKWATWVTNIAIDCNPASTMLGMVMVAAGTSTQLIRIYCSGNPSSWGVHTMTGAELCNWGATSVTIGGQKCSRLTIQMKSGSGTFFAIYGVSDPNHY